MLSPNRCGLELRLVTSTSSLTSLPPGPAINLGRDQRPSSPVTEMCKDCQWTVLSRQVQDADGVNVKGDFNTVRDKMITKLERGRNMQCNRISIEKSNKICSVIPGQSWLCSLAKAVIFHRRSYPFVVSEQVQNNTFPMPLIIRFT